MARLDPIPLFFPPARAMLPPLLHARLLDDLIRKDKQRRGERDAERLRRLAVEDELELPRPLYRQVRRLGAFQDAIHVVGSALQ